MKNNEKEQPWFVDNLTLKFQANRKVLTLVDALQKASTAGIESQREDQKKATKIYCSSAFR